MTDAAVTVGLLVSALLGAAFVATTLVERQRDRVRGRIGRMLGPVREPARPAPASPQLAATPKDLAAPARRVLPAFVAKRTDRLASLATGRISTLRLVIVALLSAIVALIAARSLSVSPILAVAIAAAAAAAGPVIAILYLKGRYDRAFLEVFPDALDLIVRAVKAGLPVSEALTTVGSEISDPVGTEFRLICDQIRIAVDLNQALIHASHRIQIIEFRFFVSCLALQRQTGGNLAETLGNLSTTIRRRNEMRLKAKALSSEGRVSAIVLSLLPIGVSGLLFLVNPVYISMLFKDSRGHHLLLAAGISLAFGVAFMRFLIKRAVR